MEMANKRYRIACLQVEAEFSPALTCQPLLAIVSPKTPPAASMCCYEIKSSCFILNVPALSPGAAKLFPRDLFSLNSLKINKSVKFEV